MMGNHNSPADLRSITRRLFFRRAAGAAITAAVVPATVAVAAPAGPITPAQWHAEMLRIGWQAYAMDYRGRCFGGVVEHCNDAAGNFDHEVWRSTLDERGRLSSRVHKSGADFWNRTAQYLWDRGLRESVGPAQSGRAA